MEFSNLWKQGSDSRRPLQSGRLLFQFAAGRRWMIAPLLLLVGGLVAGQQAELPDETANSQEIAAIVAGYPISITRVERQLKKSLGKLALPEQFQDRAKSEALEHLIRRHVVFESIRKSGAVAGKSQILLEITKLKDRLKEVDQTMDDYLQATGLELKELEYEYEWRIAWKKYLDSQLDDERLAKFYQENRRQFDGTEMKVAHLLIQDLSQDLQANLNQAKRIREEIASGKLSWADAVASHSDAKSSSSDGGEIGWIGYEGPMPAEFCRTAMKLQVDQISPPVESAFGVHLIKCLEINPGKIGPRDARDEVRAAATQFLFDSLAGKNRDSTEVQYIVDWPIPETHPPNDR